MKTLNATFLEFGAETPPLKDVSAILDSLERNRIEQINWNPFPYKPDVSFAIGYTSGEIMLKYYVREDCFKAEMTTTNQNVYEDSCVEAFLSPSDDGIYYNMEFNGTGICLLGSGTSRETSLRTDPSLAEMIRRESSLAPGPVPLITGNIEWTLTIAIPFGVFFRHRIGSLKGKAIRANFYKCGDKLLTPHYITWSPVKTPAPDFHRPEFFGEIRFK
jgi:hypothetical protein